MKNIKDNIKHKVQAKQIERDVGFAMTNIVKKEKKKNTEIKELKEEQ